MLLTCIQSNSITLYLFVFLNCSFKLYFLSSVPAALFSIVFLSCISCAVLNRISCAFLLYFSTVFLVYFSTVFRRCSVDYQEPAQAPASTFLTLSLQSLSFFLLLLIHLASSLISISYFHLVIILLMIIIVLLISRSIIGLLLIKSIRKYS